MSNVEDWERRHALPRVLSYILTASALVLGFVFLVWGISQLWTSHQSKSWAHAQGVVYQSEWVENHLNHGEGTANIAYRYSVGGQSYEGTNILPGTNEYLTPDIQAKLRQYPVGANVTVFYDPADPQDSALEIGVITDLTMFGLATFFILGATALVWRLRSGRPIPHVGYGTEPPPVIEDYNLFPKDK